MTVIDILNLIPDLKVRFWALENCKKRKPLRYSHLDKNSISQALLQGFIWENALYPKGTREEKRTFWENQFQKFKQIEAANSLELDLVANHFTPVD